MRSGVINLPDGLPWTVFFRAFPFGLLLDKELRVLEAGPSAKRLLGERLVGVSLTDLFAIEPTMRGQGWEWLRRHQGTLMVLRPKDTPVRLAGEFAEITESVGAFLGSPWMGAPEEAERWGLNQSDFALHDSRLDLAEIVGSLRTSNQELQMLNHELEKQKRQVFDQSLDLRKLAMVAEHTTSAVVITDAEGRIEWVNLSFERMTGWTSAEVMGHKPGHFLQGAQTDAGTAAQMRNDIQRGGDFDAEILNYRKNGESYWVRIEVHEVKNQLGGRHLIGIQTEVTEQRHRALEFELLSAINSEIGSEAGNFTSLRNILARFGSSTGAVWAGIWRHHSEGTPPALDVSWAPPDIEPAALARMRGRVSPSVVQCAFDKGMTVWVDNLRELSEEWIPDALALGGQTIFALPLDGDDENAAVMEVILGQPLAAGESFIGALNNHGKHLGLVIRHLRASRHLRESEWILRHGQRLAGLGTWEWVPGLDALSWSDEKFRIYGFEPGEVTPTMDLLRQVIHPKDAGLFFGTLDQLAREGGSAEIAFRIRRRDGELRHVRTIAEAETGRSGTVTRLIGTLQDISPDVEQVERMNEAERIGRFGTFSFDPVSGKFDWSLQQWKIMGFDQPLDFADVDLLWSLVHPEDLEMVRRKFNECLEKGGRQGCQHRIQRADGIVLYLDVTAELQVSLRDGSKCLVGTVRDITDSALLEQEVRESRDRWDLALNTTGLGVWDWDIQSGHVIYSEYLETMLGYRPGEWPQHVDSWASRIHPEDKEHVAHAINGYIAGTADSYLCEHRLLCRDGRWKWVQDVGKIVERSSDGKPSRMVGTQLDIDARKLNELATERRGVLMERLRSAQMRFIENGSSRGIFEELLDITIRQTKSFFGFLAEVLSDERGAPYLRSCALTDISWNEATRELMAEVARGGEMEFRNLDTLFGAVLKSGDLLIANDARNDPRRGGTPQGHPPIETFAGIPVYHGVELVGVFGVANRKGGYDESLVRELDPILSAAAGMISARREARKREVIELELREAKERAELANHAKSRFLATISHEIRTPMNGVIGMASLMRESPLPEAQFRMATAIHRSGVALMSIIDEILDFAKIESGHLDIQQGVVDLPHLVEEVLNLFVNEAWAKQLEIGVDLEPDVPPRILTDENRVRQVLMNLVGNAIKFTPSGHVLVSAGIRPGTPHRWLVLKVHDTGVGVQRSWRRRIFDPFSQVDGSHSRSHGGTGLGLAISRELVGLMGGQMGVMPRRGGGSVFWLRIPLVETAVAPDETPPKPHLDSVQIVCSSEFCRELVHQSLRGIADHVRIVDAAGLMETTDRDSGSVLVVDKQALKELDPEWVRQWNGPKVLVGDDSEPDSAMQMNRLPIPGIGEIWGHVASSTTEAGVKSLSRPEPTRNMGQRSLSVLLAEDNEINAEVARLTLERIECQVAWVTDGQSAVDSFKHAAFDLVLMDCQMPGMDGYEASRRIREWESEKGLARCPILAVTASALPGEAERCTEAGMDGLVTKPFELGQLRELLPTLVKPNAIEASLDRRLEAMVASLGTDNVRAVCALWAHSSPGQKQGVTKALLKSDYSMLARHAHKLKGTCMVLGMKELAELCLRFERDPRRACENTEASLAEFEGVFLKASAAVEEFLLRIPPPPRETESVRGS